MNSLMDEGDDGLEETIERVLQRVIANGRGKYTDFDDRINDAFAKGTLGDDELTRALVELSSDSEDILYALSCDPSIMKKLRGMSGMEAVAWTIRNLPKLQQGIDLNNTTQQGYEKHRKMRGPTRW